MRDWFDLNNDGKLDTFEEACKWSHINNSIEQLEKNNNSYRYSGGGSKVGEGCGTVIALIIVFYVLYLIYC